VSIDADTIIELAEAGKADELRALLADAEANASSKWVPFLPWVKAVERAHELLNDETYRDWEAIEVLQQSCPHPTSDGMGYCACGADRSEVSS
jgi:hypothetical protein